MMNRRQFLKTSSALALGAVIPHGDNLDNLVNRSRHRKKYDERPGFTASYELIGWKDVKILPDLKIKIYGELDFRHANIEYEINVGVTDASWYVRLLKGSILEYGAKVKGTVTENDGKLELAPKAMWALGKDRKEVSELLISENCISYEDFTKEEMYVETSNNGEKVYDPITAMLVPDEEVTVVSRNPGSETVLSKQTFSTSGNEKWDSALGTSRLDNYWNVKSDLKMNKYDTYQGLIIPKTLKINEYEGDAGLENILVELTDLYGIS